MRKTGIRLISVVFVLVVIFTGLTYSAKTRTSKQINIFGSLGIATSDIEDPLVDMGIEIQLVQGLFFRLEVNTHLGSRNYYNYYTGYYGWYDPGIGMNDGTILHGLGTSGVYKIPLVKKLKFFIQTGLNYLFYWTDTYDNVDFTWRRRKKRGFGAAVGTGFEYNLSEKLGLTAGGTYIKLFADEPQWHPDIPSPGPPDWVKIYLGFFYRLK